MNLSFEQLKKLWVFNEEGLELFDYDMRFLQPKETLYISFGQDFKVNTYYSEYEFIRSLGQGGFG